MSQMFVTISVKDADSVYVPVADAEEANRVITQIESSVLRKVPLSLHATNGRYMVNTRYVVSAHFGKLHG